MLNDIHRAGWYWLVGALVLGMPAVGSGQGTVATDRAALEALYDATDGANWSRNDSWLTGEPLGDWYGVGTDSAGRVTTLALWDNGLAGPIPAELGSLTNLTYLELGHDELTGSIPAELGNLINLQGLLLWNEFGFRSQLTGSIPAELGNLTNLVTLSLEGNQLTGSIPAELGNLINLDSLFLSNNELTGSVPAELGSLINLKWLLLYENNLSGPLPASMTNLQLVWLSINNNAGLCAPADAAFQAWLATIDDYRGDTCAANGPPAPVGVLPPVTLGVDDAAVRVEVGGAFSDPDGDALTYSAISSAPSVASVAVVGSTVTVAPVSEGAATVTVTATDAGGSNGTATQAFPVTVSRPRPPGACTVEALGTLTGTVTRTGALADDCVSPNFSGELARYYSFTLETPATVEIDLVSSEFDAWLALREGADAEGRALVQDDDGGQGTNSRIDTALSAGTYTIEATSYAPGETGAFTLTVTAAGAGGGGCAVDDLGALSGTVVRVGNLGGDCESPNYSGRLARYYSFTLGQAGSVEMDLFSTAFDTFLTLREGTDVEGPLVTTDDDGGQGTNSRIATELSAGTYTVEATSYATGITGGFTLRVTAAGGGGGGGCAVDDLGALSGTATRVGNLGNDCVSPNYSGRLARYYSFTLGQAGSVEIDLVSSVFDAFLALREGTDVEGRLVATDDDGGQATNSRISTELSAGTYTIEATSYATGVTGAFTVTATAAGGGGGGGCALDDLGALSGTVTRVGDLGGDCASPNYAGRLARYYSFTLGQAGSVEIDLVSSAFDTFLALREGTGVEGRLVTSDDDGGQGTNSRIGTELPAGTYTIEATSYATGVTGAFTLTVTGAGGGGGGGCALDDLGALSGTATRVGNLGGDCESPNYSGRLARYYSFTLGQAESVEIDLVSSAFDTFLALRVGTDAAGRLVSTDDDGGQGTNSRIGTELPAGTYTIEATSYATGVTGAFTLTATAAGGGGGVGCALDDLGALSGTATRVGNLGDDCTSPNYSGRLARYYSFTLGQAGSVTVNLFSSAFDTFLTLRAGAGVSGRLVASDDDGGQGTNSRIGTELPAGTYTIEATSYGPGVTGAFSLTVTTTAGGGGNATDRAVLEALYDATGGAGWTDSTNWKTSAPLGEWYGVTTDADGRVRALDLAQNGLAGPIPVELGNLVNLEALNFGINDWESLQRNNDNNNLTGPIPVELGNLVNLERLNLAVNYLTGPIPVELGNLVNLEYLHLGGNALTPIPVELGNLVNLEGLFLWGNALTGPIPAELGNLVNLTSLSLSSNELTGSIPVELGNLVNLERLWLHNNALTGPIPAELGSLVNLERLWLHNNALTGPIPAELGSLVNLELLSLYNNALTGPIPVELGDLVNVEELRLFSNELTGSIPVELGNLVNLERLFLWGNALTGPIPVELGNLVNLTSLSLGINELMGSIPVELGNLVNLTSLSLSRNALTGSIPVELGNLVNLTSLSLSRNALTGSIPAELGNLVNLESLWLYRNALTGPVPVELGNLVNLETLWLSDNQGLTGPLPAGLRQSPLERLNISATQTCAPAAWREWLATIEFYGSLCDAGPATQSSRETASAPAFFTDDPLVPGVTPVRAIYFAELRTRIDALRVGSGLARFPWTDPVLVRGVTPIRAVHLQELRVALGDAYVAAGRAAPGWTDGEPTPGVTPIKAVYVMELRAAVVALERAPR